MENQESIVNYTVRVIFRLSQFPHYQSLQMSCELVISYHEAVYNGYQEGKSANDTASFILKLYDAEMMHFDFHRKKS